MLFMLSATRVLFATTAKAQSAVKVVAEKQQCLKSSADQQGKEEWSLSVRHA